MFILFPSFNRTSMESKPLRRYYEGIWDSPFNRTSMESKLRSRIRVTQIFRSLLIEPVWNRNKKGIGSRTKPNGLLIEPVWNRNIVEH